MLVPPHIRPSWVVVHGACCHVSTLAALAPAARPPAYCPLCEELITPKVGAIRTHHYAHRPDSRCAAAHPETALHLNTKFYLAQQLRSASSLRVAQTCAGGRCGARREIVWQADWDDVAVEFTLGSLRPDIALLKGGRVVAAIEVVVTHAMGDDKKRMLGEAAVPWVELEASAALYEGDAPWTPAQPLPVWRSSTLPPWTCDSCVAAQRQAALREAQIQRDAEYRRHNYETTREAMMVDSYFCSGKKYREVAYLVERYRRDTCVGVFVRTEDGTVIADASGDTPEALHTQVKAAVEAKLDQLRARPATDVVHVRIAWRRWEKGRKFVAKDTGRFPFSYTWDAAAGRWRRPYDEEAVHAIKVVDLYFSAGEKRREIFYVVQRYWQGLCAEALIRTGQGDILAVEPGELTEPTRDRLNRVVRDRLAAHHRAGALVDAWAWRRWEPGTPLLVADEERYVWGVATRTWELASE
ncbi:competence protein CoiA [Oscillochloris sp. ZM17-4]|uniref:competence protein CoiA family protein n=1 Tax=Oscillochloris sp. ZM17-4 TaxID=2866714 RepID=UPI001C72C26C|nr:competence protein CoiA family protein [Oscillochloris sp. ZM17-4]MBX0330493.1 competence protein CoiA [Oscillochloris sp. ZM17-4]